MKSYQRGFIPLVAIIVIGIAVIAGGTAVTLSLKGEPKEDPSTSTATLSASSSVPAVQETANKATTSPKATISSQVKTSAIFEGKDSPEGTGSNVESRSKPVAMSKEDQVICDTIAKEKIDTSKPSLGTQIQVLCELIPRGKYQEEALNGALESLRDKWDLWSMVQAEYKERDRRMEQDPHL